MTSVAFLQQDATCERETSAIAALLSPHEAALRFLCRELLGNHDDAEDALQETFLRAIRGLPKFRQDAQLKTWLTRIAIRVCLEQRRRPHPISELPPPVYSPSPETQTLQKLWLQSALGELSPRRRAIFLLKEVEGWSLAEIAEATGTNTPLIKIELYRARKALKSWVARQEIQEKRIP